MLRSDKRHPAALELLGSMGASGAEHFGLKAEDPEDTPFFGFNQSFPARWFIWHFGLPPHRAAMKHITTSTFRNSATCANNGADLHFERYIGALYRDCFRIVAAAFRHLGSDRFPLGPHLHIVGGHDG
jgi:hypothetical protein